MDLTTTYLGLKLRTPLVPSASPLSEEIDGIKRMEDAGASAVVLYSLFEEQLRQDRLELNHYMESGTFSFAEALVPSASPLSEEIDGIKRMEDAGASAVVLYSLFEEQLRQDRLELNHYMESGTFSFAEALTYFPEPEEYHLGPEEYLKHIATAKKSVKIPVIASLNGSSPGGWTQYAKIG